MGGKAVRSLDAGATYRFAITDRRPDVDFRLLGPGVNRLLTHGVTAGKQTTVLRLRAGIYRYQASCVTSTVLCEALVACLKGSFRAA